MAAFGPSRCVAFCWDSQAQAYGIKLERRGARRVVTACWSAQKGAQQTWAEVLRQGYEALGADAETLVLVGGDAGQASVSEVVMPRLAPADLRLALALELARQSPVPVAQVQWAYRVLGPVPGERRQRLRVVCVAASTWQVWVAAAAGLSRGVDAMLPPVLALDPVLAGRAVQLDGDDSAAASVTWAPVAGAIPPARQALRSASSAATDDEAIFGAGSAPLALPGLELGPLSALPAAAQRGFAGAVVLALYGVSGALAGDRVGLPELPAELRPRRQRPAKVLAGVVALYVAVLLLALVGTTWYHQQQAHRELRQARQQVRAQALALAVPSSELAQTAALYQELSSRVGGRKSLALAVSELSQGADRRLWCQNLAWTEGELQVTLVTGGEATGLTDTLKQSPLFSNYREDKRVKPDNATELTLFLTMKPWTDLAVLPPAPPPRPSPRVLPGTPPRDPSGAPAAAPAPPAPSAIAPAAAAASESVPVSAPAGGTVILPPDFAAAPAPPLPPGAILPTVDGRPAAPPVTAPPGFH